MHMSSSELLTSHCQVFFNVQPLSNGIKGDAMLSTLSDGLIEGQLIVGAVIAGEGRGATGEGEVEG